MYNLFLNGCLEKLEIILFDINKVIDVFSEKLNKNLTNILIPSINNFLQKNNILMSDIKNIYVVNGPGSFTSVKLICLLVNTFKFVFNHINLFETNSLYWYLNNKNKIICMDAKTDLFYVYASGFKKPYLINKETYQNLITKYDILIYENIKNIQNYNIFENLYKFKNVNSIKPLYIKPAILWK